MSNNTAHQNSIAAAGANLPTIYYDGYCNMCSRLIQFVYRHGGKGKFRFMPLPKDNGSGSVGGTVIFEKEGRQWTRSDAVIRICMHLSFPWNCMMPLLILPASWRDAVYNFVAVRRLRWFGARESCFFPEKDDAGHPE